MDNHDIDTLLSNAGIRPSAIRVLVAKTLMRSSGPLSSQQIETTLQSVDRSSITRSLALFVEHNFVHTVDDGSGSVKYELCHAPGNHSNTDFDDRHPHFHCVKCGATICLEQQSTPSVELPEGFVATGFNFVIKGLCADCATGETQHR